MGRWTGKDSFVKNKRRKEFLILAGLGGVGLLALAALGQDAPSNPNSGRVKITSADTTLGFLSPKLVAGTNVTLTVLNPGANEQLRIDASGAAGSDEKVKITSADTTTDFLNPKISAGTAITKTVLSPGANESLQLSHAQVGTGDLHTDLLSKSPSTSARNTLQPTADIIPLTIRGFSGQNQNLFEVQDSVATPLAYVDSSGSIISASGNIISLLGSLIAAVDVETPAILATADPLTIFDSLAVAQLSIGTVAPEVKVEHSLEVGETITINDVRTGITDVTNIGITPDLTITGSNRTLQGINVTPAWRIPGGTTGHIIRGFNFVPTISALSATPTIAEFAAVRAVPQTASVNAFNVTTVYGLYVLMGNYLVTTPTVTTQKGIFIDWFDLGTVTTAIGLDIDLIGSGSTRMGIRQQGGTSVTNRIFSPSRFGDITDVPTAPLESSRAATNPLWRGFVQGEANPRVQIQHDRLEFGPGGGSALDIILKRSAVNEITVEDTSLFNPTSDIVPVVIKPFASATSDALQVYDAPPTQAITVRITRDGVINTTQDIEIVGSGRAILGGPLGLNNVWSHLSAENAFVYGSTARKTIISSSGITEVGGTNLQPELDNAQDFGDYTTPTAWRRVITNRNRFISQASDPAGFGEGETWYRSDLQRYRGAISGPTAKSFAFTDDSAPTDAEYIVGALHAGLSAERLVTNTATITWDLATVGQAKANIPDDAITYAKIQNVSATSRFLGRITAGAGDIEELTGTQATTLLDVFTSTLKGLTPASGGGTTNFLRADATWAVPPGATHNILSATHPDTTAATVVRGDLVIGQGVTPKWERKALGSSGFYLRSDATDALWSALLAADLSGRVAQANSFLGTVVVINADETDATGTTTNANAKTYSLAANTYALVMAEAEVSLDTAANEDDEVTFDLQYGGVSKQTLSLKADATGAGDTFKVGGVVKYSEAAVGAQTLRVSVTVNSGAGTWRVQSLRVYGVI